MTIFDCGCWFDGAESEGAVCEACMEKWEKEDRFVCDCGSKDVAIKPPADINADNRTRCTCNKCQNVWYC
jgi:hypothetical protein